MNRFIAYRRNISQRDTHNELQKNADNEPQFEGVIWSDGTVTLRWLTACRSHSVWASVADMLNIHGHPEYGTEIEWLDGPPPAEWIAQVTAAGGTVKESLPVDPMHEVIRWRPATEVPEHEHEVLGADEPKTVTSILNYFWDEEEFEFQWRSDGAKTDAPAYWAELPKGPQGVGS